MHNFPVDAFKGIIWQFLCCRATNTASQKTNKSAINTYSIISHWFNWRCWHTSLHESPIIVLLAHLAIMTEWSDNQSEIWYPNQISRRSDLLFWITVNGMDCRLHKNGLAQVHLYQLFPRLLNRSHQIWSEYRVITSNWFIVLDFPNSLLLQNG